MYKYLIDLLKFVEMEMNLMFNSYYVIKMLLINVMKKEIVLFILFVKKDILL